MRITISVAILVAFLSSSCTSARLFQRRSSRSSPIGKVEMVATQNSTTHSSLDESDDDWQNSQFTAARIISSSSNLEASNLTRNDSISNIPESECDETDRHRHTNHRRSNSKSNDLSSLLPALPFLPILIVLALMFICLCAVLRLFSKAHFRDHRSSIFVNPRTLDVAQAQERRMSQLSQCSARMTPSRRPTIVSSNYYHRSPIASINSAMQIQAAASRSARSSWSSNGSSGGPGGCDAVPLANMAPITLIAPNNRASTLSVYHASNSILMKEKARSNSISSSSLLR